MSIGLLSEGERQAYESNADLQRLNVQDMLALKSRLAASGYYELGDESANIETAWNEFKQDVMSGASIAPSAIDKSTQAGHVANIVQRYVEHGTDIQGAIPQTLNDIARVVVSDPGHEDEFGYKIRDNITEILYDDKLSEVERTAFMQGVMRTFGVREADGQIMQIDGLADEGYNSSVAKYYEMESAYFTLDEALGRSGIQDADLNGDGRPDATDFDVRFAGNAVKDDFSLYQDLDEVAQDISSSQVMMIQGTLNALTGAGLEADGVDGRKTQAALKEYFTEIGVDQSYIDTIDEGINSHHMEILRNHVTHDSDVHHNLQKKLTDLIDQEVQSGKINGLRGNPVNNTVLDVQASMNMLGHKATMDGIYGGQTANNLNEFSKLPRDQDADFWRLSSNPESLASTLPAR